MALVATLHNKLNPHMLAEQQMLRLPAYKWWFWLYIITTFKRVQYYYVNMRATQFSFRHQLAAISRRGIGLMQFAT